MRLRKPCEHGRYEAHKDWDLDPTTHTAVRLDHCPGGEFLADDALVIEALRVYETRRDDYLRGPRTELVIIAEALRNLTVPGR